MTNEVADIVVQSSYLLCCETSSFIKCTGIVYCFEFFYRIVELFFSQYVTRLLLIGSFAHFHGFNSSISLLINLRSCHSGDWNEIEIVCCQDRGVEAKTESRTGGGREWIVLQYVYLRCPMKWIKIKQNACLGHRMYWQIGGIAGALRTWFGRNSDLNHRCNEKFKFWAGRV